MKIMKVAMEIRLKWLTYRFGKLSIKMIRPKFPVLFNPQTKLKLNIRFPVRENKIQFTFCTNAGQRKG